MILLEKILGGQGCLFIDAASSGNKFYALVVNDDCVLSTLTSAGGQNLLTKYGLSGKTLKAGALIPMFNGDPIAAVTPASGSLIGYGNENN
jgi:predicted DNA-binding WGR domain protein